MPQSMDVNGTTYAFVDCEITQSIDALERAKGFNEDQDWTRTIAALGQVQAWVATAVVRLIEQQRIDDEARKRGEIE